MQVKIKEFIAHPLISGSSIIFVGSFAANIINYIFNILMGRMLSVQDYGLLLSLTSVFILFGVFNQAFINTFSKFSAKYFATDNKEGMHSLYTVGFKFLLIPAVTTFTLFVVGSPVLSKFLHVSQIWLLIIISFAVLASFLSAMPNGILQGRLSFVTLASLNFIVPIIKLFIAVPLIYIGFSIYGAVMGITLASVFATISGFYLILRIFPKSTKKTKDFSLEFKKSFFKYSYTTLLASLGITLMSNTDILLVRHFFDEVTSGQYAALSLMGKAIFYFTSPIQFVFFPLIAQKKERLERLLPTLVLTLGIIGGVSGLISLVYFITPQLVLNIFFPKAEYALLKEMLGIFSVYILLFSLMNVLNNFFLSTGRTEVYRFTIVGSIVQILLIIFFHESLYQIIWILCGVNFILFILLLLYFFIHGKD